MSAAKVSHQFAGEPRRIAPDAQGRAPRSRALRVFRARAGRDPETDEALKSWIHLIELGLDAEAPCPRVRVEQERRSPQKQGPGHPELNPLLTNAIAGLVDEVGASNAALLMMLAGCDQSMAFPICRDSGDPRKILRRLAKRLSQIRGRVPRQPTPDLEIVISGAVATLDPATGTIKVTVPPAARSGDNGTSPKDGAHR